MTTTDLHPDTPIPYTLTAAIETAGRSTITTTVENAGRWTVTTTNGIKVTGHLPPFAEADPSESGVAPDWLANTLDDICHQRHYDGQAVHVDLNEPRGREVGTRSILCPQIEVQPFHKDPAKRVPTAVVELVLGGDDWIGPLDPAGVTELAAKLRAQADVLDQVAHDLRNARADWAKNGTSIHSASTALPG